MAYASPAGSLPGASGHGLAEWHCPVATLGTTQAPRKRDDHLAQRHDHFASDMIISPAT